ncbi:MAG TPA: L,D-transpeptidase family protein [Gammaproteobacteria bacterium]
MAPPSMLAQSNERAQGREGSLEQAIREQLAAVKDTELPEEMALLWRKLRKFYSQRRYQPVWFDEAGLNAHAQTWLETIKAADTHGLDPNDYQLGFFQRHHDEDEPASLRVWTELLMTKALMLYIEHMQVGRLTPTEMNLDWHIEKPPVNTLAWLQRLLDADNFQQALDSLQPPHLGYKRLRTALLNYLALQTAGGWPSIPDGPVLQTGDSHEQLAVLRRRLQAEGDLLIDPLRGELLFDETVKDALEHFQVRHGIDIDGVLGPATRAAMNIPIAERIQQMRFNLERWRWLPSDLGERYILVNTAGYELAAYEHNEPLFLMRVIAGTPERRTPAVTGPLQSVEFNPYWYIPRTIALNDILPLQQRDPNYLTTLGIRVFQNNQAALTEVQPHQINWADLNQDNFPYQLRQNPGPNNSLGNIKFKFSNNFALYLHDTPKKGLFNKETRAFSSGCIRVESAIDLAGYLLQNHNGWTKQKIQEVIDSGATVSVDLQTPIPLYLVYWTAWVGSDEHVYFRKDIYGWDQSQSECK